MWFVTDNLLALGVNGSEESLAYWLIAARAKFTQRRFWDRLTWFVDMPLGEALGMSADGLESVEGIETLPPTRAATALTPTPG